MPGNGKNAEEWSSQGKFGVVLETARLNEAELAEYCRLKGLFVEQAAQWRLACQEANMAPDQLAHLPALAGRCRASGLIAALLGDGAWDDVFAVALGVPTIACAWYGLRRRATIGLDF